VWEGYLLSPQGSGVVARIVSNGRSGRGAIDPSPTLKTAPAAPTTAVGAYRGKNGPSERSPTGIAAFTAELSARPDAGAESERARDLSGAKAGFGRCTSDASPPSLRDPPRGIRDPERPVAGSSPGTVGEAQTPRTNGTTTMQQGIPPRRADLPPVSTPTARPTCLMMLRAAVHRAAKIPTPLPGRRSLKHEPCQIHIQQYQELTGRETRRNPQWDPSAAFWDHCRSAVVEHDHVRATAGNEEMGPLGTLFASRDSRHPPWTGTCVGLRRALQPAALCAA